MNREQAEQWARHWIDGWNLRDVQAILAGYRADVIMYSPTAEALTGNSIVRGRAALANYWGRALSKAGSLCFAFDRMVWDDARRTMFLVYLSRVNERRRYVTELFVFDAHGKVQETAAFHGGSIAPDTAGTSD